MALKIKNKIKIYEKWRNIKHNEMHTLQSSSWYKACVQSTLGLLFKTAHIDLQKKKNIAITIFKYKTGYHIKWRDKETSLHGVSYFEQEN